MDKTRIKMSLTQCVNSQHLEIMRESLDRKLQDLNGIVISPDRQLKELFCRYLKTTALKVIKVGSRAPMKNASSLVVCAWAVRQCITLRWPLHEEG